MHPLGPIRLRDLTPAARREERSLRASELADGSCNVRAKRLTTVGR